jgi:Flp pilus assembly protein TadD
MRQFAPASADLERAVELEPEHLLARVRLGLALQQLERHEEALGHFANAAPRVVPDRRLAQVIDAMSESLTRLPRSESSPAATLAAIHGLQDHPDLLHALGLALVQRDETTLALTVLTRAAELTPDNAALARDLGSVLVRRGYLGRALRRFEQALRLDPEDEQAAQMRVLVLESIEQRRRARESRGP